MRNLLTLFLVLTGTACAVNTASDKFTAAGYTNYVDYYLPQAGQPNKNRTVSCFTANVTADNIVVMRL